MKEDFTRIEKIEKYLTGQMKGSELHDFEKLLETDKSLLKELERFKLSIAAVNLYGKFKLKKRLGEIHNTVTRNANLHDESIISLSEKVKTLIKDLFDKYFIPYDNVVTVRSSRKDKFNAAMTEYSNGSYGLAIKIYKNILKDKPKDTYVLFYCGVSLLEEGKYNEAIRKFTKLLKIDGNIFLDQAKWYLGLAYLRNNELEKALRMFSEITTDNPDLKVKKIIKEIKTITG